ncbi:type II secretion system protein GspJ [Leptospira sp. GIMC2001]|uniref:type II secretion system protein GspJ n=1 Tax=Leptospira sp. GIMC2001 TaxID=1513297 RepID=UPI00234B0C16|nr:type II secretion system protein GspJ [Leptospira sp. GIMC2001]WCL51348.1 prepilin-type cleavage/methylation domain-containing protein [Leptospira sp. GIMC2001]
MTLIEISIVVMLMSVLFTGIFTTFFMALKISREADPPDGTTRPLLMQSIENIRSTLSRTYFFESQKRLVFIGKNDGGPGERNDRIVFASAHPNAEETDTPSVREVSFYLKKMESKAGLFQLIRREDDMVDNVPLTGGVEHVLLENVKSFQMKYSERGDKWLDEWNSKTNKKIPRLIRIEIIALVGNQFLKYESLAHPGILFK